MSSALVTVVQTCSLPISTARNRPVMAAIRIPVRITFIVVRPAGCREKPGLWAFHEVGAGGGAFKTLRAGGSVPYKRDAFDLHRPQAAAVQKRRRPPRRGAGEARGAAAATVQGTGGAKRTRAHALRRLGAQGHLRRLLTLSPAGIQAAATPPRLSGPRFSRLTTATPATVTTMPASASGPKVSPNTIQATKIGRAHV